MKVCFILFSLLDFAKQPCPLLGCLELYFHFNLVTLKGDCQKQRQDSVIRISLHQISIVA